MRLTDAEIRDHLRRGEPLSFPELRGIRAEWIEELIQGPNRTIPVRVEIVRGRFEGRLDLTHVTFESDFILEGCQVNEKADFRFATFKRAARFNGTRFIQTVTFSGANAELDFEVNGTGFPDGSVLNDLRVGQVLSACGAQFGAVDLSRLEVRKFVDCSSAVFGGDVTFEGGSVAGDAKFDGARFVASGNFKGLEVGGSLSFRPFTKDGKTVSVSFGGRSNFAHLKVSRESVFPHTVFEKKAEAIFVKSDLGEVAIFSGASFLGRTFFYDAQIHGDALFNVDAVSGNHRPVRFVGDARFDSVHIEGNAVFHRANFEGRGVVFHGTYRRQGAVY